ncbi:hypothetical protein DRQ33_00370, partial [bacterium]
KMKKIKIFISILSICLIVGCAAKKATAPQDVLSAVFSPQGYLYIEQDDGYSVCGIDTLGNIINCQPLEIPHSDDFRLIAIDTPNNRYFYAGDDSVFMFDRTTGLTRPMTRGAFAENVECARVSPTGEFLAFSSALWKLGDVSYWRLVIVDAIEGGIVHYCDSLLAPDAFQWINQNRLGYIILWNAQGKFDTLGAMFDTHRRVVLSTRDRTTDFLQVPCNPVLSYDGVWKVNIIDSVATIEQLKQLPQPDEEQNP